MSSQDNLNTARERAAKRKNRVGKEMNKVLAGNGLVGNWIIAGITEIGKMIKKIFMFILEAAFDIINFIYDLMFGSFKGIFGGKDKLGPQYSYKYIRYFVTLVAPPLGILLSRGAMGWFSIIICGVLCMLNYFVGIIYAFVVMHARGGYANRYEKYQMDKAKKIKDKSPIKHQNTFPIFFISLLIMFGIIAFIFGSAKMLTD